MAKRIRWSDEFRDRWMWKRVKVVADGCWLWQGALDRSGYGRIQRHGRCWMVHRYFYDRFVGPIPDGLEIDHLCCKRSCVRPDHLEPVDHLTNINRIYLRRNDLSVTSVTVAAMLVRMFDADQLEVLGALKDVQCQIAQRDREQAEALTGRTRLVQQARDLGLSQAQIASHIGVRPNVLGQAALRERRRSTSAA